MLIISASSWAIRMSLAASEAVRSSTESSRVSKTWGLTEFHWSWRKVTAVHRWDTRSSLLSSLMDWIVFSRRKSSRSGFPYFGLLDISKLGEETSERLLAAVGSVWFSFAFLALHSAEQQRWFFCLNSKILLQCKQCLTFCTGGSSAPPPLVSSIRIRGMYVQSSAKFINPDKGTKVGSIDAAQKVL